MNILTFYKVFYNRFYKDPITASALSYAAIDLVIIMVILIVIEVISIVNGTNYLLGIPRSVTYSVFALMIILTKYLMERNYKMEELPRGLDNKLLVTRAESLMVWSVFIFTFIGAIGMAIVRKYLVTGT